MQHVISQESTSDLQTTKLTRALLACGVVAGPLFTVVGLTQAFTRPGFDLTRHALSLLENGNLGWIQISSFLLTGLLFIACAVGMRQVLRGSRGGTWGPRLIAILGAGLIGAAFFRADPGLGFPPGTPADANTLSWHGLGHLILEPQLAILSPVSGRKQVTISHLSLSSTCALLEKRGGLIPLYHQQSRLAFLANHN